LLLVSNLNVLCKHRYREFCYWGKGLNGLYELPGVYTPVMMLLKNVF